MARPIDNGIARKIGRRRPTDREGGLGTRYESYISHDQGKGSRIFGNQLLSLGMRLF